MSDWMIWMALGVVALYSVYALLSAALVKRQVERRIQQRYHR